MSDIVERLKEKIIVDAFAEGYITSGALADRLIRERLDAADEIERLRERLAEADECNRRVSDENEKLREALKDCAVDLEAEINARYHDCNGKVHPALQHKYDRDMSTVRAAASVMETDK